MKVITQNIDLKTKGNNDVIDITYKVAEKIAQSGVDDGQVLVFVPGSTGGVTTMEYEPGQIQDLQELLDALIPRNQRYAHNHAPSGSDGNAHSHLRASTIGPDITVPFQDGQLLLGTWQQIVFIDFDIYPRQRTLIVQITGD